MLLGLELGQRWGYSIWGMSRVITTGTFPCGSTGHLSVHVVRSVCKNGTVTDISAKHTVMQLQDKTPILCINAHNYIIHVAINPAIISSSFQQYYICDHICKNCPYMLHFMLFEMSKPLNNDFKA